MNTRLYPCLWFNQNAPEAADFYRETFRDVRILQDNPQVITLEIRGAKLMLLNGDATYRPTPAISYFVYCNGETEIDRLYDLLKRDGKVLMPLGTYDWTPRYAWVEDRFGVNWQLDVEDIRSGQKIVPALLFTNDQTGLVREAMNQYTDLFEDSRVLMESPFPPGSGQPEGKLLFAQFRLRDMIVNAMSSPLQHGFDFSPGNSFVVECDDQDSIDRFWAGLGDGGRHDRCGWLADRFGISWQVVPAILGELMADPERAPRVMEAFLKMKKFDIEVLMQA